MITQEQIFSIKQEMQDRIAAAEKELQQLVHDQQTLQKVDDLARTIIRYEEVEHTVENAAHVFSFFAAPVQSVLSPLVKAEVLEYVRAATEIDPTIGVSAAQLIVEELRVLLQSQDDDTLDMVESEYKNYILPALLIAGACSDVNDQLREMMRYCAQYQPSYGQKEATDVLKYAIDVAIDMALEPSMPVLVESIRTAFSQWLQEADQAELLDACEERLASIRFEKVRGQNLAHEKAIEMLERREKTTTSN